MIIGDTNVFSELVKPRPHLPVVHWFERFGPLVALPTVVIGELFAGVEEMNDAERRLGLEAKYKALIERMKDRVLVFDVGAALEYGSIAAHCKKVGAPMKTIDGKIAAVARANRAPVATRNVRDFSEAGVKLINPWEDK